MPPTNTTVEETGLRIIPTMAIRLAAEAYLGHWCRLTQLTKSTIDNPL